MRISLSTVFQPIKHTFQPNSLSVLTAKFEKYTQYDKAVYYNLEKVTNVVDKLATKASERESIKASKIFIIKNAISCVDNFLRKNDANSKLDNLKLSMGKLERALQSKNANPVASQNNSNSSASTASNNSGRVSFYRQDTNEPIKNDSKDLTKQHQAPRLAVVSHIDAPNTSKNVGFGSRKADFLINAEKTLLKLPAGQRLPCLVSDVRTELGKIDYQMIIDTRIANRSVQIANKK